MKTILQFLAPLFSKSIIPTNGAEIFLANSFSKSSGNRMKTNLFKGLLLFVMFFCMQGTWAQRTASQSGNWNSTTTWGGASVPSSSDPVTIAGGFTVTVDITTAVCSSLQLGGSGGNTFGILTFAPSGSPKLVVTNGITVGGSGSTNVNRRGEILFVSGATLEAGSVLLTQVPTTAAPGIITMTSGSTLKTGSFGVGTGTTTWTPSTGTVFMTANNTLPASIFTSFNDLIISSGTTTLGVALNSIVTSGSLTVKAGATLALSTFSYGATTAIPVVDLECGGTASNITGTGVLTLGGDVTVTKVTGTGVGASVSCPVALGATRTFTVADETTSVNDLTMSGIISGSTFGITKEGAGTMLLSGANTYTGATTVNGGTLKAGVVTSAFGSASAVTLANTSGVILDITGFSNTIGSLIGGGTSGGNVTLGAATLTIGSNNTSPAAYAGIISGTGAITKSGTGTLILSGNNTYSGLTTISAGTLKLGATGDETNTPLGTTGAGTSVTSGAALDLNGFTLGTAEALTLNGTGVSSGGALTNSSATAATYSGLITLGAASSIVSSSGDIVISNTGTITGATFGFTLGGTATGSSVASIIGTTSGTLTKAGTGTWTLSGASTYTGLTTISAGTLKLGATSSATNTPLGTTGAGTSVTSGAALDLNGFTLGTAEALTLNGTGVSSGGALTNSSATAATYSGLITLGAASSIVSSSGDIVISNTGTITGATFGFTLGGTATGSSVASIIGTTSGTLTKAGTGTWTLSGANTFSGAVTVSAGILEAGISSSANTSGPFGTVGAISVTSGAAVDMAGFSLTSGHTQAFSINGTGATASPKGAITNSSSTASTIIGVVTFATAAAISGDAGLLNITGVPATGTSAITLGGAAGGSISTVVAGARTVTKIEAGTWTLSGANTFSGAVAVNGGILKAGVSSAVNTDGPFGTVGAISVASGAAVDMAGFSLTSAHTQAFSINGTGATASAKGAITNSSSTASTIIGVVTFATAAAISGDAGLLNITGVPATGTSAITLGGAAGGSISTVVAGARTVTKIEAGTWTLSGTNTYTGGTTVNAGTLKLSNTAALGATANAFTIASDAKADVVSNVTVGSLTLGTLGTVNSTWGFTGSAATYKNANYFVTSTTGVITVSTDTRATPTVTPTIGSYSYTGLVNGPTAATNTGTSSSYTFSYSGTGATTYAASATRPINAGSYTITATLAASTDGFYKTASSTATAFSISAAPLTITANDGSKTYGQTFTTGAGSANFTSSGLQNSQTIGSITIASTGAINTAAVGSYTIVPSAATGGTFTASNYSITYTNGSLTLGTATLTITGLSGVNKVYNGLTTATSTGTPAYSGLQNSETASVTGTPVLNFADANVGTGKTITVTGYTAPNANYSLTQPSLTGNITTATLTITGLSGVNKVYNGLTTATSTGTAAYSGLQNSETASVTGTAVLNFADANVGTGKTITVTGYTAPSANYSLTQPSLTGNITTAPLTITGLSGVNKVYNGLTTATSTGTAAYSGLQNSETASVTGTPVLNFADANVGTGKTITVTGYTAPNANYSLTQPSLTGNITTATLTVTSNTATHVYGSTLTPGASATPLSVTGMQNAETLTGTVTLAYTSGNMSTSAVGTYTGAVYSSEFVKVSGTATLSNYTISYVTNDLSVTVASLTITADDAPKCFGVTYTLGTTAFTSIGLQNEESIGSVTLTSSGASSGAVSGTYSLIPSGATGGTFTASNYSISYTNGTLTVRPVFTTGTISSTGQTICYAGTPTEIGSTTAAGGGDNTITYSWRSSADSYTAAISDATNATFTPSSGLTSTTSYKRYANDGTCNNTPTVSNGTWTVTVRPVFTTGTISSTGQTICYAGTPTEIASSTAASGGDNTITYSWRTSADSYTAAISDATNATFTPSSGLTSTTSYKRYANDGTCNNTPTVSTGTWTVTVNPTSVGGTATATISTLCYNSGTTITVAGYTGSIQWQQSSDGSTGWANVSTGSGATTATYTTPNLTATTYYKAVVTNGVCSSANSNTASVTVNPTSVGGTITSPTICYNSVTAISVTGYTGTIQWQQSSDGSTGWANVSTGSGATTATYTTPNLTALAYYRAVVTSGVCSSVNSNTATVSVDADNINTWIGTSGNWSDTTKWRCGEVPSQYTDVVVNGGTPNIDVDAVVNSITVNGTGILTVQSGKDLTVTNALTTAAATSLVIENTANLLQPSSTNNVSAITVKRNSSAINRFDYTIWSSPVSGQGLYAFSRLTLPDRFYKYITSSSSFTNSVGFNLVNMQYPAPLVQGSATGILGTDNNNVTFEIGKGYLIRTPWNHPTAPATWTGWFMGVPNNGNISVAVSTAGAGFNLVGNPYPSRLNISDFIATNTNITGTLYFWRKTNTTFSSPSYCTITNMAYTANGAIGGPGDTGSDYFTSGVGQANWDINIGQGFFVKVNSGSTINFTNSMRRSSNTNQFFRNAQATNTSDKSIYWLNLTNNAGLYSQMAVGYLSEATLDVDRGIDGKNINTEFNLTSFIGTEKYSIQGRPDFDLNDIVPMSYKANTVGNHIISIDRTTGIFSEGSQHIYLKDKLTNTIHDLNISAYTFTSQIGTFDNRFEVMYQATTPALISPSASRVCAGSSTTITASNYSGAIQWQQSTDGTSGWQNVTGGSGANAPIYITPNLTTLTYYRAIVTTASNSSAISSNVLVTVDATVVGGTVLGSTSVCSGTSTELNLSGYTGLITKWQSSTTSDFSSNITDINNTTSSLTASNVMTTTYYRARVASGICSSANSNSAAIIVYPNFDAGIISGSTSVCIGTNSSALVLNNHSGLITKWQSSTTSDFSSNVTDIANTTTSLTATNLTDTTYFRAVVFNICSGSAVPTATSTITVNAAPLGGNVGVTIGSAFSNRVTVCDSSPIKNTLRVTGYLGALQWEYSIDNGNSWVNAPAGSAVVPNNIGIFTTISTANTNSYIVYGFTQNTLFRVAVNSGVCSTVPSINYVEFIKTNAIATTLSVSSNFVCPGSATNIILAPGYLGDIQWLKSINYGTLGSSATWSTMAGTSSSIPSGNITATTWYKAVLSVGGICFAETLPAMVSIIGVTKAGTISTSPVIPAVCSGSSVTLSLEGHVGSSVQWQVASVVGTNPNWTNIEGAIGNIYVTSAITPISPKYYRAVVSNSCSGITAITATKTIVVNPASVAGTVSGGGAVCLNSLTRNTLSVSGHTGTIQWEYSINNGVSWANVPAGSTSVPFVGDSFSTISTGTSTSYVVYGFTQNTRFRVTVKSGICSSITSANYVESKIGVLATSISASNNSVCSGTATSLSLASGYVGVIKWLKSTNNWLTSSTISGTNPLVSTGNLTVATEFKATLTVGGTCVAETPSIMVNIYAKPVAKSITSPTPSGTTTAPVCTTISKVLNITSGYTADAIQWEKAVMSLSATAAPLATDYVAIPGATGTSYTVTNASEGKNYFRAKFTVDGCTTTAVYCTALIVYYKDCITARIDSNTTSAETPPAKPLFTTSQVVIYKTPTNEISINTGDVMMSSVKIFDITGKLLVDKKDINATQDLISFGFSTEILLIQITSQDGVVVTKKVLFPRTSLKQDKKNEGKTQLAEDE